MLYALPFLIGMPVGSALVVYVMTSHTRWRVPVALLLFAMFIVSVIAVTAVVS